MLSLGISFWRRVLNVAPPPESDGSGRQFRAFTFRAQSFNARSFG